MSKQLKRFLERAKEAYYKGEPIISDSQYDALEDICSEDLSVGTNKGRCRHWWRMYSLQKAYTDEPRPNLGKYSCSTPKLDGAAIALRYVDYYLDSIVTRGNGIYGEDISRFITRDCVVNAGIPAYIRIPGAVQVTGEIAAPKHISNARNYAAGAVNLKEPEEFAAKEVTFFAYDMQPYIFSRYDETLDKLADVGFNTVDDIETIDYPQDGEVIRIMDNADYMAAGFTSKHPKGAYALKERTEGVKTKILDVVWQTGKSGKVTPVAILEPINIDGATVSRATLNNMGFIEALGVKNGDYVMVERAGGIIPRIIRKAD